MKRQIRAKAKTAVCVGCVMMQLVGPVVAAPQGAQVVSGNVSVQQSGARTVINASNNAVINYQSFNIARQETVQFVQPSVDARVLNRVLDGRVTQIDGTLLSNGRVYIVNPAGIFFGGQSVVNVGGLTAAAGNLSDGDFRAGIDHFTQLRGDVVAGGRIEAGLVQLIGQRVANTGTIVAPGGTVTMVAGDDVYLSSGDGAVKVRIEGGKSQLDQPAVENSGTIQAKGGRVMMGASDVYTLAARNSGTIAASDVRLSGPGGRVENAGKIDATNDAGKGGRVELIGREVALYGDSLLDASGTAGGGVVLIGGDVHGTPAPGSDGGAAAQLTLVDSGAVVRADGVGSGDGGKVVVWADDRTGFFGHVSARGGEQGGNGGFAEISGKQSLAFAGTADLSASLGVSGMLLLDPGFIVINNTGGTSITGSRFFSNNSTGSETFLASSIVSLLNSTDLTLQANNDITINSVIDARANSNSHSLTLAAGRSIFVNADVLLKGGFDAEANAEAQLGLVSTARQSGVAVFTMASGTKIDTSTLSTAPIIIRMNRGTFTTGNEGGLVTVGSLKTADGDIRVLNLGATSGSGITVNGALTVTGEGNVKLSALVGAAETITLNGTINTAGNGDVDISSGGDFVMGSSAAINAGSVSSFGMVEIQAGTTAASTGAITMANGSQINATGDVQLDAKGNITLSRVTSQSYNDSAVEVVSHNGGVFNGGNALGVNIQSTNGGAAIYAHGDIGSSGTPLQLMVPTLVTVTKATNNNQYLSLAGGLQGFYMDAGTGAISLTSSGPLTDGDNLIDIIAGATSFNVTGDIGTSVQPINIAVSTPSFTTSGNTWVSSSVSNTTISSPINFTGSSAQSFVMTASGDLTVNATISTSGNGNVITLGASGDLAVNQAISTSGDDAAVHLFAGHDLTVAANVNVGGLYTTGDGISVTAGHAVFINNGGSLTAAQNGDIYVRSDAGRTSGAGTVIQMAPNTLISSTGGKVSLNAGAGITLSRLYSGSSSGEAVNVSSDIGGIFRTFSSNGINAQTPGTVHLEAADGIGTSVSPIVTDVGYLEMVNVSHALTPVSMYVQQATDLTVRQAINYGTAGDLTIIGGGNVTLELGKDGYGVILSGGQLSVTAYGNLAVNTSIYGASVAELSAASSGAGAITFGPTVVVQGDTVTLTAGDGSSGTNTGNINPVTNNPFFSGRNGVAIGQLNIVQDAAITDANVPGKQFVATTSPTIALTSLSSTVTVGGPSGITPSLTLGGVNTLTFTGGTLSSLSMNSPIDAFVTGATTTTGSGGININAARTVGITGSLDSSGYPISLTANLNRASSGNFVGVDIAANVNAGGGTLTIAGIGGDFSGGNTGVFIHNGAVVQSGFSSGYTVNITGTGGNSGSGNNPGVLIQDAGTTVSSDTSLYIDGVSPRGNGVVITGGAAVRAYGTGTLTIEGLGSSPFGSANGVLISGGAVSVATGTGSITGQLTLTPTGSNNTGVAITNGATLTGAIAVTGISQAGSSSNTGVAVTGSSFVSGVLVTGTATGSTGSNTGVFVSTGSRMVNTTLDGYASGSDNNVGVLVDGVGTFVNGNTAINGLSDGSGNNNHGVQIRNAARVDNTLNNNTVSITGTSGAGVDNNNGVRIEGSNTLVCTSSNLLITGVSRGTGQNNAGVYLLSGATVDPIIGSSNNINLSLNPLAALPGVHITGTGGPGTANNYGVHVSDPGTLVYSGGGVVDINGNGGSGVGSYGVFVHNGALISTGGAIGIIANATSTNADTHGLVIQDASTRITGTGGSLALNGTAVNGSGVVLSGPVLTGSNVSISITGQGGGAGSGVGVLIGGGSTVQASGSSSASIAMTGTGAPGAGSNHGVEITGSGTTVSAPSAAVTIAGQGGNGSGGNSIGVYIHGGAVVSQSGGSSILTINGSGGGSGGGNAGVTIDGAGTRLSGAVSITGTGGGTASTTGNIGVALVNSAVIDGSSNSLSIVGAGNPGVEIGGSTVTMSTGTLSIYGYGAPNGIWVHGGAIIQGVGSANLALHGIAGPSGVGIDIQSTNTRVVAGNGGQLFLDGQTPDATAVSISSGAVVNAVGNSSLQISGYTGTSAGVGLALQDATLGNANHTGGSINIVADRSVITGSATIGGAGSLLLSPYSSNVTYDIGSASGGTYLLDATTIGHIQTGFNAVQFNGINAVNGFVFQFPTSVIAPGLLTVTGSVGASGSNGLTLTALNDIDIQGALNVGGALTAGTYGSGSVLLHSNITAGGAVTILSPIVLYNDINITSAGAAFGRINSDSVSTPRALYVTATTPSLINFFGTIGAGPNDIYEPQPSDDRPLSHLETSGPAGSFTILGNGYSAQTIFIVLNGNSAKFNNAAQIANDVDIHETGPGNVVFASTLDAAPGTSPALAVDTSGGSVQFSSVVGGATPLGSINTGAGDAVVIGASIKTTGNQTYAGPVTLTGDATLTGAKVTVDTTTLNTNGHTLNTQNVSAGSINPATLEGNSGSAANAAEENADAIALAPLLQAYGLGVPKTLADNAGVGRLESALGKHTATLNGAAFDPAAFVTWLRQNNDEAETLAALEDMARVLNQVGSLNVTPAEAARLRQRVLLKLAPKGMTPAQLEAILQNLRQSKSVAAAASL